MVEKNNQEQALGN